MPNFRTEIRRGAVDLAWTLWAECGVSGWQRGRGDVTVDLEALILFTAALGDTDPRLRDEATDWCISHGQLVSKVRLKRITKLGLGVTGFDEFATTVNAHSDLAWPTSRARSRKYVPTLRSELDLRRPGVAPLRARALFGVAARAEILSLLAIEDVELTATQLAERIFFGRRMTAGAADLLTRAGVLDARLKGGPRSYTLARRDEVRALLGPLPARAPLWPHILRIVAELMEISERAIDQTTVVRAVETQRRLEALDGSVFAARLPHVPVLDATAASWTRFTEWAADVLARVAV